MHRAYGTQLIFGVFVIGLKSGITKWLEPTALLPFTLLGFKEQ